MSDLQDFFKDLEKCYTKEKQDFVWDWRGIEDASRSNNLPPGTDVLSDYVCFIAYNLAKNVLHGELPDSLHNRMMFQKSAWARKYVEFLER
jgi:hypothetical protein